MYKSPRKDREDKYQRLLNMIKTHQHSRQELKLLNKIKSDTIFEITLRHRRCEANKKYRFPFQKDSRDSEDDDIEELKSRTDGKDLVYDLNSQNKDYAGTRLRIPAIRKFSPREKVQTEPSQKEKAKSLDRKIKRVLIGRLEDETILAKQKILETYRYPTESTLSSKKNSVRKPSTPKNKGGGSRTCRTSCEKLKTQQSPQRKKHIMIHEFQTFTLKKIANRLRTQKSNEKKSRVQRLVSDELKRQGKQGDLIKCASSALKIKPKNILQKNLY